MAHKQTQTEWEEEMSKKILTFVRHELYLDLRFMEPALSAFAYRRADGLLTLASNGVCLFFSEEPTLRIFEKNILIQSISLLPSVNWSPHPIRLANSLKIQ